MFTSLISQLVWIVWSMWGFKFGGPLLADEPFYAGVSPLSFSSRRCTKCGKVFKGSLQKRYHEIRVHCGLTVRICPICQGVYDSDEALDLHHATIHGNPQEVDDLITSIYGRFSPFL